MKSIPRKPLTDAALIFDTLFSEYVLLVLYGILSLPELLAKWTRRCWYCPVPRYELFLHSALNFTDKAINANFLQWKQIWQEDPKGTGYLSVPSSVSFSVCGGKKKQQQQNKATQHFVRWSKCVWMWAVESRKNYYFKLWCFSCIFVCFLLIWQAVFIRIKWMSLKSLADGNSSSSWCIPSPWRWLLFHILLCLFLNNLSVALCCI